MSKIGFLDKKGNLYGPIEGEIDLPKYNNGWISIKSEDDLPKLNMKNKDDKYWTFRDSKAIDQLPLSWLHTFKQMEKENKTNSIITHYQLIEKPKPPIF